MKSTFKSKIIRILIILSLSFFLLFTLRLFYGGPGFAGQGIDIPVYDDNDNQMKIWPVLLQQLEKAQGYGYLKSPKIPNFLLVS